MAWTEDQWAMFVALLAGDAFAASGEFTADAASDYRLLLDTVEPAAAIAAVRELIHKGQVFRPKPGEIAPLCRQDATVPTFDEAYKLIFGPRGALRARPAAGEVYRGDTHAEAERARQQSRTAAVLERADAMHPLIRSFLEVQGVERLLALPVEDPDYGELRRAELREAWDRHVAVGETRQVAALASGQNPRQLDPLAALGLRAVPELEETTR